MTPHPIDTEALREDVTFAQRLTGTYQADSSRDYYPAMRRIFEAVPALLDALAAAEHRATRAEAQSAIRGRAVAIYQARAARAERAEDKSLAGWGEAQDGWHEADLRAERAEAERDEWKEVALQERGAALYALDQIKVRDARIKAVREMHKRGEVMAWQEDCTNPEAHDCMDDPHGGGTLCTDEILGHYCHGCAPEDASDVTEYPWPCATIRALDGDA